MKTPQLLAVAALSVAACSGAFEPNVQNVSGFYFAQTFTTDSAGESKDWVGLGATLGLLLNPNRSASGLLILPRFPNDSAPPIERLTGTWTLTGNTVRFVDDADTFIRDVTWAVTKNRLSSDTTLDGVTIHIVLTRSQFR
jgi:hypothetical protein